VNDGEATQPTSSAATNTVAESRPDGEPPVEEMTVGELVFEVSDRASVLIREEIELAKTEVTEKFNSLLRGSVTALVAGIFVLLALLLAMHGFAWLLNDLVFDNFWAGFFVEAGLFLLIATGAGLYAYRSLRRGAPPTPDMAIEEAKEIKQAFDGGEET
jgi:Putative Actinobacterial Holin-X, holin superfamily III